MDQPRIYETLSEFMRTLLSPYEVVGALEDLVLRLNEALKLAGSGVSLIGNDGRLEFATARPPEIVALVDEHARSQQGPCVKAARTGEIFAVADLQNPAITQRWPEYCAVAADIDMGAEASIPMKIQEQTVGALSLFSRRPRQWSTEELAVSQLFADAATVFLLNAATYNKQQVVNEQLQHALDSRAVIEQAKGIIAASKGIDVERAFRDIRNHARSHHATLRSVAEAIVSLGLRI